MQLVRDTQSLSLLPCTPTLCCPGGNTHSWAKGRDKNGVLYADPVKFPHGISYLADAAHRAGLKFGVYTDRGTKTCAGRPGALGYEYLDAKVPLSLQRACFGVRSEA